jgi:hypothetical protein
VLLLSSWPDSVLHTACFFWTSVLSEVTNVSSFNRVRWKSSSCWSCSGIGMGCMGSKQPIIAIWWFMALSIKSSRGRLGWQILAEEARCSISVTSREQTSCFTWAGLMLLAPRMRFCILVEWVSQNRQACKFHRSSMSSKLRVFILSVMVASILL